MVSHDDRSSSKLLLQASLFPRPPPPRTPARPAPLEPLDAAGRPLGVYTRFSLLTVRSCQPGESSVSLCYLGHSLRTHIGPRTCARPFCVHRTRRGERRRGGGPEGGCSRVLVSLISSSYCPGQMLSATRPLYPFTSHCLYAALGLLVSFDPPSNNPPRPLPPAPVPPSRPNRAGHAPRLFFRVLWVVPFTPLVASWRLGKPPPPGPPNRTCQPRHDNGMRIAIVCVLTATNTRGGGAGECDASEVLSPVSITSKVAPDMLLGQCSPPPRPTPSALYLCLYSPSPQPPRPPHDETSDASDSIARVY